MTHPRVYQMMAVASALRLYAKTKMRVNKTYTPKAMMKTAEWLTGESFALRDYVGAAEALEARAREAGV